MADQSAVYERFNLVRNPDGTITRSPIPITPDVPATGDSLDSDVLTKDIPLNAANNTSVRVYRPRDAPKGSNLPLIIFYHGGGFVLYRPTSQNFHGLCVRMASQLPAVVVSLDYRLAPEHRLPAAFEDAVDAVLWVKNQAMDESNGESWLRDYVDFSNCNIMGSSAGGTMVYYAALQLGALGAENLEPVKINGLILNQPFFGSVERTESELRLGKDKAAPTATADLFWELSLPIGADRDHEYCNPIAKGMSEKEIEAMKSQKCLVCIGGQDTLVDHNEEFLKFLEGNGVDFVRYYDEKAYHAIELHEPEKAQGLFTAIRDFIHEKADHATELHEPEKAQGMLKGVMDWIK